MSSFLALRNRIIENLKLNIDDVPFFRAIPVKTPLPYVRVSSDGAMMRQEDAALRIFAARYRIYVDTSAGDIERGWEIAEKIASYLEDKSFDIAPHSMTGIIIEKMASFIDFELQLESIAIDLSTIIVMGD